MGYDSSKDTTAHIEKVADLLCDIRQRLLSRGNLHDQSKLEPPEKEIFDEYTPKLKGTTYGSDEYKRYLAEMGKALKHHYENNRHHPEHFSDGVNGMTLVDLIEMFCDWKAATLRHADGDILKSIEINQVRFEIQDQLKQVFVNSVKEFGWS